MIFHLSCIKAEVPQHASGWIGLLVLGQFILGNFDDFANFSVVCLISLADGRTRSGLVERTPGTPGSDCCY